MSSDDHWLEVPVEWVAHAARLPGKSVQVGLALWFVAGKASAHRVPLSNIEGDRFGLERSSKYRGLLWLEQAGLIAVERKLGRAPIVTLLAPYSGLERDL